MENRLAKSLTTWKFWYAIPAGAALIIASFISMLSQLLPPDAQTIIGPWLTPLQFIMFAALALGFIALLERKRVTREDLGLKKSIGLKELALIVVVFIVSHTIFWLLGFLAPATTENPADIYFTQMGLDGPLGPAIATMISTVILAPICEELLYRGAILRPIHDALIRRGAKKLAISLSLLVSSFAFALPHLGGSLLSVDMAAYLVTGFAFGFVYIATGSLSTAMVSHSLQSCYAMAQVLIFAKGSTHPIIWILVFTCPILVYLAALLLRRLTVSAKI